MLIKAEISKQIISKLFKCLIPLSNKMLYSEDDYLKALAKYSDLENRVWLLKYFELYKSTLNWPDGLPPIGRTNLIAGTLRAKFYSFYRETLLEFNHKMDNEKQTLEIN